MSKVSIALCTYNGAEFLPEQLESILEQTRPPDELVVGDDCSTDETLNILENFATRAPFPVNIKVNPQNLGSTKNFEQTILRCRGEIIFLSDQDDVWLPSKIEKMVAVLEEKEEVGFVFTNAVLVDEKLQPLSINLWEITFTPDEQMEARAGRMLEVLLRRNVVTGATMAFRAQFRQSFTPMPLHIPNVFHDAWIALVIAAQSNAEFANEIFIKYRQHTRQQLGIERRLARNRSEQTIAYKKSSDFYRTELKRLSVIFEVLKEIPFFFQHQSTIITALDKTRRETEQIILHYEARARLPANLVKRVAPVLTEVLSGRYRRFSKGWMSAAKDLFGNL